MYPPPRLFKVLPYLGFITSCFSSYSFGYFFFISFCPAVLAFPNLLSPPLCLPSDYSDCWVYIMFLWQKVFLLLSLHRSCVMLVSFLLIIIEARLKCLRFTGTSAAPHFLFLQSPRFILSALLSVPFSAWGVSSHLTHCWPYLKAHLRCH